jgi:hypothetical protein
MWQMQISHGSRGSTFMVETADKEVVSIMQKLKYPKTATRGGLSVYAAESTDDDASVFNDAISAIETRIDKVCRALFT